MDTRSGLRTCTLHSASACISRIYLTPAHVSVRGLTAGVLAVVQRSRGCTVICSRPWSQMVAGLGRSALFVLLKYMKTMIVDCVCCLYTRIVFLVSLLNVPLPGNYLLSLNSDDSLNSCLFSCFVAE